MGSGHFAEERNNKAANIDQCIFYLLDEAIEPYNYPTKATKPSCYSVSETFGDVIRPGVGFFYGGAGGAACELWLNEIKALILNKWYFFP